MTNIEDNFGQLIDAIYIADRIADDGRRFNKWDGRALRAKGLKSFKRARQFGKVGRQRNSETLALRKF